MFALGDDVIKPVLTAVMLENVVVYRAGLFVRDGLEIDTVKVLEGGQLVAIETRCATFWRRICRKSPQ
jgi:hypothetical protein